MTAVERLTYWVKDKHAGQIIRKTGLPYFNHLITVATLSKPVTQFGFEIGLCHDLLEDTDTSIEELFNALQRFGYTLEDANDITASVVELTDFYTKTRFPDFTKAKRKKLENNRLLTIRAAAQSVKYADLIDNISWVIDHDKKHAAKYLHKKLILIKKLDRGNAELRTELIQLILKNLNVD